MKTIPFLVLFISLLLGASGAMAQQQCSDLFAPELKPLFKMTPANAVNRYFELWEIILQRSEKGKKKQFPTGDLPEYRSALEDMQKALKDKLASFSESNFPKEALVLKELLKIAEDLEHRSIPYDEFILFWDPYVRVMDSNFGRASYEGMTAAEAILANFKNGYVEDGIKNHLRFPKASFFIPDTRGSGYGPFIWPRFSGFRVVSVYSKMAIIHHNMQEPLFALHHDFFHERVTSKITTTYGIDFVKAAKKEYLRYKELAAKFEKIEDPYLKRAVTYLMFQVLNETATAPDLASLRRAIYNMNVNKKAGMILSYEVDIPSQYFKREGGQPGHFLGDPVKGDLATQTGQNLARARAWILENIKE